MVLKARVPANGRKPRRRAKDAEEHLLLGRLHEQNEDHERAIAEFTAAIRLDPTQARVYYERGETYTARGDKTRARADFRKARRLDPEHGGADYWGRHG